MWQLMTTSSIGKYRLNEWTPPSTVMYFDFNCAKRFVKDFPFSEAAQLIGAAMKEKHTIIEKWPFRLKLRPG